MALHGRPWRVHECLAGEWAWRWHRRDQRGLPLLRLHLVQVAIEAAGFERDILAALRPLPRLSLGMVPLGQVQASAFECGETTGRG